MYFDEQDFAGEARLEVLFPALGIAVVVFIGHHDRSTSERARRTLSTVLKGMAPGEILVADLSSATFIDASIIGALAEADKRAVQFAVDFHVDAGEEPSVRDSLEAAGRWRSWRSTTTMNSDPPSDPPSSEGEPPPSNSKRLPVPSPRPG